MKVLLIDNSRMCKYDLPEKVEDSFIIDYKPIGGKQSFITLEAENGVWKIRSNGSVNIINGSTLVSDVELIEYSGYMLKFLGVDKFIILYAMPTLEPENYKLDFNALDRITIGNSQNCNICYNNSSVHPLHADIKKVNDVWTITACADAQFQTFVNNGLLVGTQPLEAGDVLFINGFKLIWMRAFLQINNPNKQVTVAGLQAYASGNTMSNTDYTPVSDEEQSVDLYSEDDYFYHMPRMKESVEPITVKIDSPPASEISDDLPFLLTIGSTITMGASSLMMGYNVAFSAMSGRSIWLIIPQIVMCLAMLIGSMIMPKLVSRYQKKKKKEREKYRQTKYTQYLAEKEQEIILHLKKQVQIMRDNSVSIPNCSVILSTNNRFFWSRRVEDDDFLTVRLGIGSLPAPIEIQAPEKSFTLDEDNLTELVYQVVDRYKKIDEVPVSVSLLDKRITSFVCECSYRDKFIDGIILQLVALHSPSDLKIVIFTDEIEEKRWEHMKMLQHCWSEDRSTRFFATNYEERKDLAAFLEEELKKRKELVPEKPGEGEKKKQAYNSFDSYFLIITDAFREMKNIPFMNELFSGNDNHGFSYMVIEESMRNVPTNSDVFIQLAEAEGAILEKNINVDAQIRFKNEYDLSINMNEISNKIANIPVMSKEGLSVLPNSVSFLDMFNVAKVEQLNIINRWKINNPVTTLSAPIGVRATGDLFKLDLHEKFHGPHGLIAGMTGSGKSEFIITYILSMCINYHPYEVQFVLIDYKGGGLAGAFENKETGVRIPHLTGTITNLDTAEMNRTLVSIESELKRRQRIFNETRDALGESTIDIYKYQRLYREGQVVVPMAHLFIISDEFAELKSQQPDFMNQLISTARIGRSLGVHLILATQKPSGVVNDQIWSNSKFKICLRVQDRSDSMEMLKKPDAASLKEAGRFYLQVGYDEFFDIGQSGWAGSKYVPSDRIIRKVDDSIDFVNNVGYAIKSIKDVIKTDAEEKDYGDQLTNVVRHIYNVGVREELVTNKLWLDAIPAEIYIDDLKAKYQYETTSYLINPIIGESDSPATQEQHLLTLDLTNGGNTAIIGQSGSGKENLITTILWSTITNHTPDEMNFYIIDCGAESLKVFGNMPHVGSVGITEDVELNLDMLMMISDEIERRKGLMSDYAGSYTEYLTHSGKKLPLIAVIINNYEVFLEQYGKYEDKMVSMYRDGARYGIVFILTAIAPNTIRSRVMQNFPNKMIMQLPKDDDYRSSFNTPRGLFPSRVFGRGLVMSAEATYEFQTAMFTEKQNINVTIREAAKTYNQAYTSRAKKVPSIPPIVSLSLVENLVTGLNLPIGYSVAKKEPYFFDFSANKINLIVSHTIDPNKMSFFHALIQLFQHVENTKVKVIDFVGAYDKNTPGVECLKDNLDNGIVALSNEILAQRGSNVNTVGIFLGIGTYKNKLNIIARQAFDNLCLNLNTIDNAYFVFIDTVPSYKHIQIEQWYQSNIDNSTGIWLDADPSSQLVINAPNVSMDERKVNFPYIACAISKGQHNIIKHVVEDIEEGSNEE